ncbi:hypothetical protein ADIMK_3905 [Marinobacterium lacunae]|uniref:Uncharacterized protein n=1 Tax=Marinobacterium lacunae TaxID=1232683 RepID=A0A081FTA3_9GAMM|nr:hypothetical protein ADIMK_3905 [Marinobacterium lacunae]
MTLGKFALQTLSPTTCVKVIFYKKERRENLSIFDWDSGVRFTCFTKPIV